LKGALTLKGALVRRRPVVSVVIGGRSANGRRRGAAGAGQRGGRGGGLQGAAVEGLEGSLRRLSTARGRVRTLDTTKGATRVLRVRT